MYETTDDINEIVGKSKDKTVFIFKHSDSCPISAGAKTEVDTFVRENPDSDVYLVVVQEQRPLSNEIEQKLKTQHESPQLLIIEKQKVKAVLNHRDVTIDNIKDKI